ncbi:hypothetical protein [Botrimarina hoheduenensis]|uniref:IRE (Iron responsive element) n=1 Tax=Botrimarina hoheduenensis TaxID=2528000 RepID=A0A5C5WC94_9BACT|nr:hypothetical protein [Botrimarina hoheduenensis]TWT48538.1 hypothetical protein Pla111_03100 [Botrimarina hoheduenensis]
MNQRGSFYRKVTYGAIIAALLVPLSLLSSPATRNSKGGVLSQLRAEHRLGQADLGEIDPASETIKLATLGLRGLAVQLLWNNANEYKKKEDWTNLTATLEQLAKLQPNFITFWKYQAWNLSYNVSVEFDDYKDRYYWVRRGIQFLQQGARYNRDNPKLLWELGWVLGQKIGRSDEKVQYRRLFKADTEYHPEDRPPTQRDNWLRSKAWYEEAVAAVDERGQSIGKQSPIVFYSSPAKSQMNYSEAIGEDGLFQRSVAGWRLSEQEWKEFATRPIEHSTGVVLRYAEQDEVEQRVTELTEQLSGMVAGVSERIVAQARKTLTPEQLAALEIPPADRDEDQYQLSSEAERILEVTPQKIADQIATEAPEKNRQAQRLAAELRDTERKLAFIKAYKDTANFDYWMLRSQFEQSKAAVNARELIFRARQAFDQRADVEQAKQLYEQAFARWADVFAEFPQLSDPDGTTGDDVMYMIYDYNRVLEQLDEEVPEDFPLWNIIENFDTEREFRAQIEERRRARGELDESAAQAAPAESASSAPAPSQATPTIDTASSAESASGETAAPAAETPAPANE